MSAEETFSVPVRSAAGQETSTRSIAASDLDARVRYRLLKQAFVMYEANRRAGTHKVKSRGEIAGSGQKPWRQKGTGRARSGSRKSPIWRGGGTVFGPKPRDYSFAINRKQRRLALRSAIYDKFSAGNVFVLDGIELSGPSTKTVAAALKACGVKGRCLIGTKEYDRNLVLSARNIPGVEVAPISDWNARQVLLAATLVFLPDALGALESGSASS